jgi:hypothetical protein
VKEDFLGWFELEPNLIYIRNNNSIISFVLVDKIGVFVYFDFGIQIFNGLDEMDVIEDIKIFEGHFSNGRRNEFRENFDFMMFGINFSKVVFHLEIKPRVIKFT